VMITEPQRMLLECETDVPGRSPDCCEVAHVYEEDTTRWDAVKVRTRRSDIMFCGAPICSRWKVKNQKFTTVLCMG
jgi:hypothetical protein